MQRIATHRDEDADWIARQRLRKLDLNVRMFGAIYVDGAPATNSHKTKSHRRDPGYSQHSISVIHKSYARTLAAPDLNAPGEAVKMPQFN